MVFHVVPLLDPSTMVEEIADIFPSKYIHLGGDEAGNPALDCWTDCPKCQALKKKLGITTTDRSDNWQLQGYLFDRVIELLRDTYHKTPMFWYETDFKKIQPGCVTFAWRHGLTNKALEAAVENNARIMLCPGEHCYFDRTRSDESSFLQMSSTLSFSATMKSSRP